MTTSATPESHDDVLRREVVETFRLACLKQAVRIHETCATNNRYAQGTVTELADQYWKFVRDGEVTRRVEAQGPEDEVEPGTDG